MNKFEVRQNFIQSLIEIIICGKVKRRITNYGIDEALSWPAGSTDQIMLALMNNQLPKLSLNDLGELLWYLDVEAELKLVRRENVDQTA